MKKAILLFAVMLSFGVSHAQEYNTGVGLRGGFASGVTLKHFISRTDALEGILATHYRGLLITGLYQKHTPAFDVMGLNWFYGGGAHLGVYNGRYRRDWFENDGSHAVVGLDGIVGIEYKIQEIPISISVDLKPAFNLIGHTGFAMDFAVSLRYVW